MKKLSDTEFLELMINKEFELINSDMTYQKLITEKDSDWYNKYSLDYEQYLEWKEYFMKLYPKWRGKKSKSQMSHDFSWFALRYAFKYNFDLYKILYENN